MPVAKVSGPLFLMFIRLLSLVSLVTLSAAASAQASFSGLYVQSFDDIGGAPNAELPEGWRVQTLPGVRTLGDFADASPTTDAHGGNLFGQDAPTGAINFGSGPEATATERAIGFSSNGGIGTGLLYFHFRSEIFGAVSELWYSMSEETYRGGQDEAESQTEVFYSYDGTTWHKLFGVGLSSGGQRDGYEDAPAAGGSKSVSILDLPTPLQQGDEFYLAFRYSAAPGWGIGQVPAQAFDDFALGLSYSGLQHIFVGHGERVFGEVPVGDTSGPLRLDYNALGDGGEDPVIEITGPAAADFSAEPNDLFSEFNVFFTPSEPGPREATLRFRIGSLVSRGVALRGGSGEPGGELEVRVERVGDPAPIPSEGGRYRYRVSAEVDGPEAREVEFWSDLLLPDGRVVALREPEAVEVGPGGTWRVGASRLLRAPWPTGTYTQRFYWGAYPDQVEAETSLTVEKLAGVARAASTAGETEGPNPFQSRTAVRFDARGGEAVRAELFDAVGRRIRVLYEGTAPEGRPLMVTVDGQGLPAGVYVVRLVGEDGIEARTIVRAR